MKDNIFLAVLYTISITVLATPPPWFILLVFVGVLTFLIALDWICFGKIK